MAKSQLEIVLIDGDGSPEDGGAVQDSGAQTAEASPRIQPAPAVAPAGQPESRTPAAQPARPEGRPTAAPFDEAAAARIAQTTAQALGLGQLVAEIRVFAAGLRDVGLLFRSGPAAQAPAVPQVTGRDAGQATPGPAPQAAAAPAQAREPLGTPAAPAAARPAPAGQSATVAAAVAARAPAAAPAAAGTAAAAAPAAASLATLGTVAAGAGAVAVAFAGVVHASRMLADTLREQVHTVEGFSGAVSAAIAESEIRMEHAIAARAQRLGPQLADFERQRGGIEARLAESATRIYDLLLRLWDALEPAISAGVAGIELGSAVAVKVAEDVALIRDIMTFWDGIDLRGGLERSEKATAELQRVLLERFESDDHGDPLEDQFLADFVHGASLRAAQSRHAMGG